MHSAAELRSSSFRIEVGGGASGAQLPELRAGEEPTRAYAEAIAARVGEVEPMVRSEIKDARSRLVENAVPVETYRRIGLDDALALLTPR